MSEDDIVTCIGCNSIIIENNMRISTHSLLNKSEIDINGEKVQVPTGAKFIDAFYCSCNLLIKTRFRA